MPIRPENRARYPANWKEISKRIRFERAKGRCECTGECGSDHTYPEGFWCAAPHGWEIIRWPNNPANWVRKDKRHVNEKSVKVVLTVAHLDHTPENVDDANLLAMCQRCHLRYDREHHAATARETRDRKSGQGRLF